MLELESINLYYIFLAHEKRKSMKEVPIVLSIDAPMGERMDNLIKNLARKGLKVRDCPYDGSCFFHAVFRDLKDLHYPSLPCDSYAMREAVCSYLQENERTVCPEDVISLMQLSPYLSQCNSFKDYIALMRKPSTYVDYVIILATQKLYKIDIDIVYDVNDRVERVGNDDIGTELPVVTIGNMLNYHFVGTKKMSS